MGKKRWCEEAKQGEEEENKREGKRRRGGRRRKGKEGESEMYKAKVKRRNRTHL